MKLGRLVIAAGIGFAALLAVGIPAAAAANMTFTLASTGEACADCQWIAAHGELVPGSTGALAKFLKTHSIEPGTLVRLDSEGGSLEDSLDLGRLIRASGLRTSVGGTRYLPAAEKGRRLAVRTKGMCASACAYTFIGGVERSVEPGSRLGVHQFYTGNGRRNRGSDASAQAAIASMARYMEDMGVASGMIVEAARTPPTQMNWLPRSDLERLRITTNVEAPAEAEWAFGQAQGSLYLVSRQTQKNGSVTEFRVACSAQAPQTLQISARRDAPLLSPDRYESLRKSVSAVHFNRPAGDIALAVVEADATGVRIAGDVDRAEFERLVGGSHDGLAVDLVVAAEYAPYLGGASHLFPVKNLGEAMPVLLRNCAAT